MKLLPNRVVAIGTVALSLIAAVVVAASTVDWHTTAGILGFVVTLTGIGIKFLSGSQQAEAHQQSVSRMRIAHAHDLERLQLASAGQLADGEGHQHPGEKPKRVSTRKAVK